MRFPPGGRKGGACFSARLLARHLYPGPELRQHLAYRAGASIREDIKIYIYIFLYRSSPWFFLAAGHLYRQPEPAPPGALPTGWRVELIAASGLEVGEGNQAGTVSGRGNEQAGDATLRQEMARPRSAGRRGSWLLTGAPPEMGGGTEIGGGYGKDRADRHGARPGSTLAAGRSRGRPAAVSRAGAGRRPDCARGVTGRGGWSGGGLDAGVNF